MCGIQLVPISIQATTSPSDPDDLSSVDPVEEALVLFRANSLFRAFDVRGPGDKLLVYLILFISSCLRRLAERKPPPSKEEARQLLFSHAHDRFPLPGQAGFPLGGLMAAASGRDDEEVIRLYIRQCREETGRRLVERLYASDATTPNKHWLAYAHRRFMDRAM